MALTLGPLINPFWLSNKSILQTINTGCGISDGRIHFHFKDSYVVYLILYFDFYIKKTMLQKQGT